QLDFPGRNVLVNGVCVALFYRADHRNHVLVAQLLSLLVNRGIVLLVKNHLGHARSIAQINENDAAQVTASIHPTHEDRFFPGIGATQVWVRRKSPKKSSKGSSFLLGIWPKPNQEL